MISYFQEFSFDVNIQNEGLIVLHPILSGISETGYLVNLSNCAVV